MRMPETIQNKIAPILKNQWTAWGLRYGGAFLVFLVIYLPFWAHGKKVSDAFEAKMSKMDSAKKVGIGLLGPKEMGDLNLKADAFERGFAQSTRVALLLDHISDQAIQNHLKLGKVNSDTPEIVTDSQGVAVTSGGNKLMRIPINLQFETGFRELMGFLKSLAENAKYSYVVETYSFQKPSMDSDLIQCEMTLSFFSSNG